MKLVEFQLDPNRAKYFALSIAINPDQIIAVEPDCVATPKDEYECASIIMANGNVYFVADEYNEVLKKING